MDNSWVSLLRSHKSILLVSILVIVSFAVSYAYFRSLNPLNITRAKTISWPLEFSMEVVKTEFLEGENVSIKVSLKNVGNGTVGLSWPRYYTWNGKIIYSDFSIFAANGTEVYRLNYGRGYFPDFLERTLNVGEELIDNFEWAQVTSYPHFAKVPNGLYSARASVTEVSIEVDNHVIVTSLETPSISFRIRQRAPVSRLIL